MIRARDSTHVDTVGEKIQPGHQREPTWAARGGRRGEPVADRSLERRGRSAYRLVPADHAWDVHQPTERDGEARRVPLHRGRAPTLTPPAAQQVAVGDLRYR